MDCDGGSGQCGARRRVHGECAWFELGWPARRSGEATPRHDFPTLLHSIPAHPLLRLAIACAKAHQDRGRVSEDPRVCPLYQDGHARPFPQQRQYAQRDCAHQDARLGTDRMGCAAAGECQRQAGAAEEGL